MTQHDNKGFQRTPYDRKKHTAARPGCRKFFALVYTVILLFLLSACGVKKEPVQKSGFCFDTIITMTLYGDQEALAPLFEEIFSMCNQYEAMFDRTKPGSDIWNINHAAGQPVTVDPETLFLIRTACSYGELTDGLIDPSIAPLVDAWNFDGVKEGDLPSLPDSGALHNACSHIDYRTIVIDEAACTVTLTDPQAALDLGFIAKGYVADRIREYLLSEHVTSAIINLGGNALCIGEKPNGSAYHIGIQYPYGVAGEIITSVSVSDKSVVTAGVYERYLEIDGVRYHHILSPETGYPIENGLLSVTILSDSSLQGDALSTTCFALGLSGGMELVESLDGIEAIFVSEDYELHYSSGLQ